MKKALWLALVSLLLAACSPMSTMRVSPGQPGWNPETIQGFDRATLSKPDRELVNVWIINDKIVIDQEPIRIPAGVNSVAIYFLLEQGDDGGIFSANGVVISDGGALSQRPVCDAVGMRRKLYKCTYTRTGPIRTPFKYIIQVTRNSIPLEKLDPTIMND